jgi:hypothetical protein
MKRIILAALLVSGCATKPPAVEVRTVQVPVIRVERCLAVADVPRKPGALPKRPKDIRAALDVALAKVLEWQGYGERTDAVLRGCAG